MIQKQFINLCSITENVTESKILSFCACMLRLLSFDILNRILNGEVNLDFISSQLLQTVF